jgi:hypothetical protein
VFFEENEAGLPAVEVKGGSCSRKIGSRSGNDEERPARNKKDEDAVQIIFPKQGGYITIPASSYPTVIDFYNGDVVVPDGTGEELETSLSTKGQDYIRSLSIESSENVTIRFDRKNRAIVNYGRVVRFRHIKVRVLEIFATRNTGIKVWASTKPKVALKRSAWTVWWWLRSRYHTGYSRSISPRNIPMFPWEWGSLPTVSLSWMRLPISRTGSTTLTMTLFQLRRGRATTVSSFLKFL